LEKREKDTLSFIVKIEPYYLGAAHLLLAKPIDFTPIHTLQRNLLIFMLLAGVFFAILGYYLGRLFIAPMRESISQMNHFIQDTTHELNTPISTILTNIEMIETFGECEQNSDELKRIEIASKTLSRIYDDLTYLNLNHHYHRQIIKLDMSQLIEERMVYFSAMAEAKHLQAEIDIEPDVILTIDKNDAMRLIDNLLSNAIKYNKRNGEIQIILERDRLTVSDTGIGISEEKIPFMFDRYLRFNSSEGGFVVGVSIGMKILDEYDIKISVTSQEGEGTRMVLTW
jgi:two-component system OmpR family sensor kinase